MNIIKWLLNLFSNIKGDKSVNDFEAETLSSVQIGQLLGDDSPKIDYSKANFDFTIEQLARNRPDVFIAAIKLLAEPRETVPYRRIMQRLHMSYHLLLTIEGLIAEKKKDLTEIATGFHEKMKQSLIQSQLAEEKVRSDMLAHDMTQKMSEEMGKANVKNNSNGDTFSPVEFTRLPKAGERDPISGGSRSWLIQSNDNLPPDERFLFRVRQPGKIRGVIFCNTKKLLAFLRKADHKE